jgi:hypothetical protein
MGLLLNFTQGGNRGEPGDAFGALEPGHFSASTSPSTQLNTDAPSRVTFYDITVDGDVARFKISTVEIALSRLLAPFLLTLEAPLEDEEEDYLDSVGNGNGLFDVGDLRAYLKR